jgi:hypothetical protein
VVPFLLGCESEFAVEKEKRGAEEMEAEGWIFSKITL